MKRRVGAAAGLALALVLCAWPTDPTAAARASDLPARLTDAEFWALTETLSEPSGTFQSDNLLSNEVVFATVVPELIKRTQPNGVYMGVGPEQNFTYIAAMKPRMAFIVDIRRGNLLLHLMYKALFEMSADRAEFFSLLFNKVRPSGLGASTSAVDLMNAFWDAPVAAEPVYRQNLEAIRNVLVVKHGFALSPEDWKGLEYVYHSFYWHGPRIDYGASATGQSMGRITYADLMLQTSATGEGLAYLGTEDKFRFVKDLESRNLIVPVVGNFAGPKAIRAVGGYLRERGATVSAFYLSNVESYLTRGGIWPAFCSNVATLPLDATSVFIRPSGSAIIFFNAPSGATSAANLAVTLGAVSGGVVVRPSAPAPAGSPTSASRAFGLMAEETKNCGGGEWPRGPR